MRDLTARISSKLLSDRKITHLFLVVAGVFVIFSLLKPDLFFTVRNITSMSYQFPEVAILSLAVMLSMLTGGIDLSIVSVSNMAALTAAFIIVNHTHQGSSNVYLWIVLAIAAGLMTGLIGGWVNAFLISKINVTPILATLATLTLFNGLAVGIRNGESITGLPAEFLRLGNGSLFGVPVPLVVLIIVSIAVALYINKTGLGLKTFLVGTNRTAARYSALGDRRVIMITYMVSGVLSSVAGLVIASRASSASPDYGSSYVLLAIVVVVLGGVSPFGGFGTVTGVIMSAFLLQMVSSGFDALRFSQFFYQLAEGATLVLVMILNSYVERRALSKGVKRRKSGIS